MQGCIFHKIGAFDLCILHSCTIILFIVIYSRGDLAMGGKNSYASTKRYQDKVYERISLGYVRDYFDLNFVNFPVFNMADVLITFGAVVLISQIISKKL